MADPEPRTCPPGRARRETVRRRGAAVVVAALLAGVKAVQLAWWPDPGGANLVPGLVRQGVLVTVLFVAVALRLGVAEAADDAGLSLRRGAPWLTVLAVTAAALGALGDPPGWSLLTLVVVTAVGEELLFRGVLGTLLRSIGFSCDAARRAAVLAFGLWHLPDAVGDGPVAVVTVLVLTSAAAALVFEPLRRRTGSVFAPAAAHLLLNGSGLLLTDW